MLFFIKILKKINQTINSANTEKTFDKFSSTTEKE